jgi:DNA-directed RNA polymerase subunit E'/Rpb7
MRGFIVRYREITYREIKYNDILGIYTKVPKMSTGATASISRYGKVIPQTTASPKMGIYTTILLTRKLEIPFRIIGRNVKDTLEHVLSKIVEGKCMAEGFIRPGSVKILTYSNGYLHGKNAVFEVVYECESCSLVEGVVFSCVIKNISLAGIRATLNEEKSPVVVFIARDHHYDRPDFTRLQEEEEIRVRVIGQRFEIGDDAISVIGELA